jgi:endonuclease/exonuclease/phosphatase family metal-dependent hydrolase
MKALKMTWSEGNNWQVTVPLPKKTLIKFKYIIGPFDKITPESKFRWDEDPNQTVFIPDDSDTKIDPGLGPLRIMSFNLRFDTEEDGPNAWDHRKELVISTIQKANPDIVATQEGFLHQIRYMKNALPNYGVYYHGRDKDFLGESCSVFYKTEKFCVEDACTQWLSSTPLQPGTTYSYGNHIPRIFTWIRLRLLSQKVVGFKINLINTHFCHTYQESRELSTQQILGHVLMNPETKNNLVIVGDFNAAPYETCVRLVTEAGLKDTFEADEEIGEGTFHGFFGKPQFRIDYIFTGVEHKVTRTCVVKDHGPKMLYPSDHFPIYADIEFKNK